MSPEENCLCEQMHESMSTTARDDAFSDMATQLTVETTAPTTSTQLTVESTDRSSNKKIGENNNVATQLVDDDNDLKQLVEDDGDSAPSLLGSMGHLVWTGTSFERQKPSRVPTRIVSLRVLSEEQAKLTARDVHTTSCVACAPAFMDTCAQTCVTDPSLLRHLGIGEEDLIPTNHKIVAVTKDPLHIKGILLVEISLDERSTNQSVYVTDSVRGLFLTMGAQMDLGILPLSYPGCATGGHVGGVGDKDVKGGGASGASRSPSPPSPAPIILQF